MPLSSRSRVDQRRTRAVTSTRRGSVGRGVREAVSSGMPSRGCRPHVTIDPCQGSRIFAISIVAVDVAVCDPSMGESTRNADATSAALRQGAAPLIRMRTDPLEPRPIVTLSGS